MCVSRRRLANRPPPPLLLASSRPRLPQVKVVAKSRTITVEGPKGKLTRAFKSVNFAVTMAKDGKSMRVDVWFGTWPRHRLEPALPLAARRRPAAPQPAPPRPGSARPGSAPPRPAPPATITARAPLPQATARRRRACAPCAPTSRT